MICCYGCIALLLIDHVAVPGVGTLQDDALAVPIDSHPQGEASVTPLAARRRGLVKSLQTQVSLIYFLAIILPLFSLQR